MVLGPRHLWSGWSLDRDVSECFIIFVLSGILVDSDVSSAAYVQRHSQSSGDGLKLAMGEPAGRVGPLPKIKLVVFRSLYFRTAPIRPWMGPFEPGMPPEA